MKYSWILLSLAILPAALKAQQLSLKEQQIVAYIDQQLPQTLKLLEELVNVNSGTLNVEGVKKVGEILRKEFDKIGFRTEWIDLPDSLKRAGHLIAQRRGKKGKKVLLLGHLDTVFEPDMPANPYRILNDSTVTGQGVVDMKGGDVIIFAALQALNHTGLLEETSVTAYFTGDEEKTGEPAEVSRAHFIETAKSHDFALAFEGGSLNTVATSRRGYSDWVLHVTATQGHSAGIFNERYGAIYEAARIVNEFRNSLSKEKYLTINPGLFGGGTELTSAASGIQVLGKDNIIAPTTIVTGDLRFLTGKQKDGARKKMRDIVANNNLPGTKATITFGDGMPSMEPTAGNSRLLNELSRVGVDMGIGPIKTGDPGSRGAGDISYIANYLSCIDGLGASGKGSHAPGETMDLKSFRFLIQRAAIFIHRLTRE